jgi:hypothetical protein
LTPPLITPVTQQRNKDMTLRRKRVSCKFSSYRERPGASILSNKTFHPPQIHAPHSYFSRRVVLQTSICLHHKLSRFRTKLANRRKLWAGEHHFVFLYSILWAFQLSWKRQRTRGDGPGKYNRWLCFLARTRKLDSSNSHTRGIYHICTTRTLS